MKSFNVSSQVLNPLVGDQEFLFHSFVRSCGLILPPDAPGADLIIPVFRTDNLMSCVVIQVKNYAIKTFPSFNSAKINEKLEKSYLKFLNFESVGNFGSHPDEDDFV